MAAQDPIAQASGGQKLYRAFVSYSHQDKKFGRWLHNRLESYRFPKECVGRVTDRGAVGQRLGRLFRDEAEAGAADNLKAIIEEALASAQDMIVICSPEAARSPWVDKEIRYFKANRPDGQVFAVILDGVPNSNDSATECFPPALKVAVGKDLELLADQPEEPLAANAAADGREDAALRLLAGLSGLTFNDLRDREAMRERAQRRRAALTMAAALVLIALAGLGLTLAGMQTWANEISRSKLLAAEAERALDEHDTDRAMLLLLAASPPLRGHFGPGFADFPDAEALLARAAFEYRLERDVQLPDRFAGLLQWRGDALTALQQGPGGEFIWTAVSEDRQQLWTLPEAFGGVIAIGRYGGPVVFASADAFHLRDPQTGRAGPTISLQGNALDAAVSDDGSHIAIYTDAGRLAVFQAKSDLTAQPVFNGAVGPGGISTRIAITNNGAYASWADPVGVECTPLLGGARFSPQRGAFRFGAPTFAPTPDVSGGPFFALVDQAGVISVRTCADGELGVAPLGGKLSPILQFSQMHPTLSALSLTDANTWEVMLWDISGIANRFTAGVERPFAELRTLGSVTTGGLSFSRNGAHLAVISDAGRLRVWDVRNGQTLGEIDNINPLRMSPLPSGAGAVLAESGAGLWRLERGVEPRRIAEFPQCVQREGCVFTRMIPFDENRRILFARNDGWVGLAQVETGVITTLANASREPTAAVELASGTIALFNAVRGGGERRVLSLWDPDTGAGTNQQVSFDFRALVISPDGALAAGFTERDAKELVLADARTGQRLASAIVRERGVNAAAERGRTRALSFSDSGDELLGAELGRPYRFAIRQGAEGYALRAVAEPSAPEDARTWSFDAGVRDPRTGRLIVPGSETSPLLTDTPNFPGDTALSPDARTLFVLENGRSVRAFDLPPRGRELFAHACARVSPDRAAFTDEEMRANPLLRSDDRRPCERGGLLSMRWWLGLIGGQGGDASRRGVP